MKFIVVICLCLVASSLGLHRLKLKKRARRYGRNDFSNLQNLAVAPGHGDLIEKLTNKNDIGYLVTIHVGSGKQAMEVLVDTGSSDLWFPSSHCQFKKNNETVFIPCEKTFNESGSTTLERFERPVHIGYMIGGMDGKLGRDNIQIANMKIRKQYFGLAKTIQGMPWAVGILGLAKPNLTQFNAETVLVSMAKQNKTQENKFGIYLKKGNYTDDQGGELIFGGTEHTLMREPLHYFNSTSDSHWSVVMDKVELGGKSICGGNCQVILDTGSTKIFAPSASFTIIIKMLRAKMVNISKDNTVVCTSCKFLPDLVFKSGNSDFTVTSDDYVRYRKNNVPLTVGNVTLHFNLCFLGFSKSYSNDWILGDVFLNKFYTEYDVANNKVGIARAV